jgi:hypothetical protein
MSNKLSLFSDTELSDLETDVDSEFEGGGEVEYSSETEVSESDEESSDDEIKPGVYPYEYVVAKDNIASTLATEFEYHAIHLRSHGTFPLDCAVAYRRAVALIDEFLSEYGIPRHRRTAETKTPDVFECPRFLPSPHLVLVKTVRPCYFSRTTQVGLLSAVVAPKGTAIEDCPNRCHLYRPAYTAVHPTSSPDDSYPVLFTNLPLLPQHTVYQAVYEDRLLCLGSITDGPATFLQPDSVRTLKDLLPIAEKTVTALYPSDPAQQSRSQHNSCGCTDHTHRNLSRRKSTTCLSDVIVDLDRSAVHSHMPVDLHSSLLSLGQEISRVTEITEAWVDWFSRK